MTRDHTIGIARLAFLLVFAMTAPLCAQERPPWWQAAWHYRTFISPTAAGAEDYCFWLEAGSRAKPDGSDIWLVGPSGKSLPCRIIHSTPEGRHLIAFKAAKSEKGSYAAYYGNPEAGRSAQAQLSTGIFLKTFPLPRDAKFDTWADAQNALNAAQSAYGAVQWNMVFDAFNPFDSSPDYISVYEGHFGCSKDGVYQFATVSDDASFLLVDGNLVAQWPGLNHNINAGRHGQYSGKVDLKAGRHLLSYVGFSVKGPKRMVAAWMPPGGDRFSLITAAAFAGMDGAQPELCEDETKQVTAAFRVEPAGYLELGERKMVAVPFASISSARAGRVANCSWDFGDGQTGQGEKPLHVYLEPGDYQVTLAVVSTDGARDTFSMKLPVRPVWTDLEFSLAKQHRFMDACRGAQPAALKTSHLFALRDLARETAAPDALFAADVELDKRRSELSRAQLAAVETELADYYLDPLRRWQEAERCLQTALASALPDRLPELKLKLADLHFYYANDMVRARQDYEQFRRDLPEADKDRRRLALIRLGDVERASKRPSEARRIYAEAENDPAFAPKEPSAIVDGRYRHEIEAYLAGLDGAAALASLEQWLWTLPTRRLDGEAMLLRLKANMLLKNFAEVRKQAEQYISYADDPEFLPQAHLYAGLACVKMRQPADARVFLKAVGERWPESPAAAEANAALGSAP